jgi:gamma-glutamylcyclotransferase (GGCT)/AIG2-like uncharacterized protein YtfP
VRRPRRYFFYGTLMDRRVLAAVIGRPPPPPARAILDGYRRVFRQGASYPVLVAMAGETVPGVLVGGLGEGDARRLEAFEGGDYVVRDMPVRLPWGRRVGALVFVPAPGVPASAVPWSPEEWTRRHRRRTLQRVIHAHRPS